MGRGVSALALFFVSEGICWSEMVALPMPVRVEVVAFDSISLTLASPDGVVLVVVVVTLLGFGLLRFANVVPPPAACFADNIGRTGGLVANLFCK